LDVGLRTPRQASLKMLGLVRDNLKVILSNTIGNFGYRFPTS